MKHASRLISAASLVAVLFAGATIPALAAEPHTRLDISDPVAVLGELVPNVLSQTSLSSYETLEATSFADGVVPDVPRFSLDNSPKDSTLSVSVENTGSNNDESFKITITPDFVDSPSVQTEGLSVSLSERGDAALYVQPIVDGLRLTSAISGPEAGGVFAYKLDVPKGTEAFSAGDGRLILWAPPTGPAGEPVYMGSIEAPWAIDAAGTTLPTWYEWADGVLTQFVDLEKVLEYPVIADPAWGYGHTVSFSSAVHTQYDVWTELTRCFNCSFPISGATSSFPGIGGVLNLDASPFTCLVSVPATVEVMDKFINPQIARFQFRALPGHFDGAGSTIGFSFYNASWDSNNLNLEVLAWVLVDRGAAANAVNRLVAQSQWNTFAVQLNDNMLTYG